MATSVADILTGSNEEELLNELYTRIVAPRNPSQARFVEAWELSGFIASDGFEFLFEQQRSIDEFAELFASIGFFEALPILQRVKAIVPDSMLLKGYDAALGNHLRDNFDLLKELLFEYLDMSNAQMTAFGHFVRNHKEDFIDFLITDGSCG